MNVKIDSKFLEDLSLFLIGHEKDNAPGIDWKFCRDTTIEKWRANVKASVERAAQMQQEREERKVPNYLKPYQHVLNPKGQYSQHAVALNVFSAQERIVVTGIHYDGGDEWLVITKEDGTEFEKFYSTEELEAAVTDEQRLAVYWLFKYRQDIRWPLTLTRGWVNDCAVLALQTSAREELFDNADPELRFCIPQPIDC